VYAGYAASAIECDRLLDEVTKRNRVLETIREILETLAGPVPVSEGLGLALRSLCRGLQADQVTLMTSPVRLQARAPGRPHPGPPGAKQETTVTRTALGALAMAGLSALGDECQDDLA